MLPLLRRRCSGTAGFKGLLLNPIKQLLMPRWLPVHPSVSPAAAELADTLPVPSAMPLGQGWSQMEAAQAGHATVLQPCQGTHCMQEHGAGTDSHFAVLVQFWGNG